jgi:hypothetical protein
MATLQDLFKSKQTELYGKSENIRIESRGLINAPRGAALLASSPNALADLIGGQIGGAIGGTANRPTDTIFKSDGFLSKPISLFKTQQQLKDVVQSDTIYYVKDNPSPASLFAKYKQGASSTGDMAMNLAKDVLNNIGGKKGKANDLKKALQKRNEEGSGYGTKFKRLDIGTTPLKETHRFTKKGSTEGWYPTYTQEGEIWYQSAIKQRESIHTTWDAANTSILETTQFKTLTDFEKLLQTHQFANQVWLGFKKYGTNDVIPFVGAVSNISEDVSPEITDYKYVGSPFKIYKYNGVERSLKFELKLYYTNQKEKIAMIRKINFLKSLAFPFDELSAIKYEGVGNQPLHFSPNLLELTITGLYKNVLGIVDTLSFNIEDNTTWSNFNINMEDGSDNTIYPNVINVSFGMKFIENHMIDKAGETSTYRYNFDGLNDDKNTQYIVTKKTQQSK